MGKVRRVRRPSGPGFAKAVFSPKVKRWCPGAGPAAFPRGDRGALPSGSVGPGDVRGRDDAGGARGVRSSGALPLPARQ